METTVKQRLIIFIKKKGLSQKRFEESVGLSNGYVNNISKGIGAEKLQRILYAFPDLNQTWLLTGEGPMLNTVEVSPVAQDEPKELYTTNSHGIRFYGTDGHLSMSVPLVPCLALGSPPDEYDALYKEYNDDAVSFPVDSVYHGRYLAFKVEGDSMDDGSRRSFQAGDIVLVRELDRDDWMPRLRYDRWPFWVVCFGNSVRIKEIVNQEGDTITLHSLNPSPEFTDFKLRLSDIRRLFNVIQVQPKSVVWK